MSDDLKMLSVGRFAVGGHELGQLQARAAPGTPVPPWRPKQLIVEMPRSLWPENLRKQMTMWAREADDPTASGAYAATVHLWRANHFLDRTRASDAIRGLMSLMLLRARFLDRIRDIRSG